MQPKQRGGPATAELTREGRLKLHDIRNHLQVVSGIQGLKTATRGRLETLFARAVRLVEARSDHAAVERVLDEIRSLLGDFLDHDRSLQRIYDRIVSIVMSSEDSPRPEVLSLGEVVRSEVTYYHTDLRRLPTERIVFSQASDPCVRADPVMLRRMIGNLLSNAAEALEEDGGVEIVVDLVGVGEPREGLLGEIRPGPYATLTVRDEGAGLPTEDVRHILQAGYSTKEGEGGRGLGMSIIRTAVEQSGGNLEVRRAEPRGTLVRVYLPAAEPPERTRSSR